MKVIVIGADGQLGKDICAALEQNNDTVVPLTIENIEISDPVSVEQAITANAPCDAVINTAAFHNVPKCEENPVKAFKVNGLGALYLSRICNHHDIPLMHVSTDYVFDGVKQAPYFEEDTPLPLNVYANTKLAGEHFVASTAKKYFILRVSGIYGTNPCLAKGYNFVDLMLKLSKEREEVRVVDDEILTPTFTEDIAAQAVHMLHHNAANGIYHVTNEGSCSWYEFAREIFDITNTKTTLNKAAPGEFAITVNRPSYSVLENKHLKDQGLNIMPHWKDAIKRYLHKKYGTSL